MKKFFLIYIAFVIAIALAGIVLYIRQPVTSYVDTRSVAVDLNEVHSLYVQGKDEEADMKADQIIRSLKNSNARGYKSPAPLLVSGVGIVVVTAAFSYIYISILKPFNKLTGFADNVARGDMDIPLEYDKSTLFGKFTWAFDRMRQNVKNSRQSEVEAIENNKTVIAALSHDIRTPVSSIRAYAEALEAGMAQTPEERAKYISVILSKCDEVTRLTDDMLLHSLSDMDRLSVEITRNDIIALASKTALELDCTFEDKTGTEELFVMSDPMRVIQIIENLVRNARKYAGTDVSVLLEKDNDYAYVSVRDMGEGIPDYRGSNTGASEGSGLGLFIVKYLITKMKGEVRAFNSKPGLTVKFSLPLS